MLYRILQTREDPLLTLLRLCLGIVFFAHGAQKALGWFGGHGWSPTLSGFTAMGIPVAFGTLAILAEFLGGIGLLLGLLTRIAAFGVACVMAVAVFLVHAPNGLFMNWAGNQQGEGFEYHILAIAIAVTLMVRGAGAFSLDHLIQKILADPLSRRRRLHPVQHHG
jgi:putative oxidoreductase